jgi:hypothetical protein
MSYTTDWEDLRIGYNRIYKKQYKTVKEMMESLYENTKSSTKMARILGVTAPTISTKLAVLGIKVNPKGGKNHYPEKASRFLNIPPERMEKMTKTEIMREIGASKRYVEKLAIVYKRKYLAMKSGDSHYGNRNKKS